MAKLAVPKKSWVTERHRSQTGLMVVRFSRSMKGSGSSITVAGSLLTEKYSSFCTCSVRVLCELGSRKGTNRRSKEDRAAITTPKMGGATVMLSMITLKQPLVAFNQLSKVRHEQPKAFVVAIAGLPGAGKTTLV